MLEHINQHIKPDTSKNDRCEDCHLKKHITLCVTTFISIFIAKSSLIRIILTPGKMYSKDMSNNHLRK